MLSEREKKRIATKFDELRWDSLVDKEIRLLGRWRADEKRYFETGDIVVLYNETFPMQVAGRVVCGGYYPLPEARIERISKRVWKEKIKRG